MLRMWTEDNCTSSIIYYVLIQYVLTPLTLRLL